MQFQMSPISYSEAGFETRNLVSLQFSVADWEDTQCWFNANAPKCLHSTLKHMQLIERARGET